MKSQPGEAHGDWSAVPGRQPASTEAAEVARTLEVDGELFELRTDGRGGTSYTWLNGPNPGYGFTVSPSPDPSSDDHREQVRAFLDGIDPATGFLADG